MEPDVVDVVRVPLDFNLNLARLLGSFVVNLSMGQVQSLLLTMNLEINNHAIGFMVTLGLKNSLVDTRQDLDNLGRLGTSSALGQNSNWDFS